MRDEGRIIPLVMQVGRLWQYYCPNIRFMQLMSNFAVWYGADPFYMEDDEFLKKFKEYMTEMDYAHAPSVIHKTPNGASYMQKFLKKLLTNFKRCAIIRVQKRKEITSMNRYNEIISAMSDRLDIYHIPHTVHDCWDGAQIRFPWCDGDVAIHSHTYGHTKGYVESYQFPWDDGDVSILDPEEALTNIVAYFIESFQNCAKAAINFMEQE